LHVPSIASDYNTPLPDFKPFFRALASLRRPYHNYLLDPGKFRLQLLLQAPDQGHTGDVSPPAETRRFDLDYAPVNACKTECAVLVRIPPARFLDDAPDLFDVVFHLPSKNPQQAKIKTNKKAYLAQSRKGAKEFKSIYFYN
jgi:hypothetical protein